MERCVLLFRISELFEIIVDFPDSEPALKDLALCLSKVDLKEKLISSLDLRWACTKICVFINILSRQVKVLLNITLCFSCTFLCMAVYVSTSNVSLKSSKV